MAETDINSKSKLGHIGQKLAGGTLKGLKYGAGIGLGMGVFFVATSIIFFGAPLSLGFIAAGLLSVTANTAAIGTALGAAGGLLKGVFSKARPNMPDAHGEVVTPESPQVDSPAIAPQQPALAPQVAAAPQQQPSASELQQLTAQLNNTQQTNSPPAGGWQEQVARSRSLAGTLQGRA